MKADYILLQDRLKGEYKDAFQKVQMYSTSNLIGEDTESELMMELLDHMLMAQEEGKPVSTIVGDDIEGFCEIFFSEYKLGNRFVDFLKTLYRMAWIMLVFAILDLVIGDGVLSSSNIGAIGAIVLGGLSGSLSILIIYLLIRPLMKKRKVNAWHAAILILCESGVCAFYSSSGKNACATYAKMRARMKAENLTLAEYVAKGGTME